MNRSAETGKRARQVPSALIIGASRGLGLEFARQYASDGWRVIGTHRAAADGARLRKVGAEPLALDVLDDDAPQRLAAALGTGSERRLDLAIVNAGIHGPRQVRIAHPPSVEDFDAVMHTNVLAPMRLLAVLAPPLAAARGTLALVTSRMGSVSAASTPNSLLYRVSKAAENMVAKGAHVELSPNGVRVLALHPGWVRTDMGGPNADVALEDSVRGMRQVLADARTHPGGSFVDYRGEAIAW
ncbi:MAG: SDR family NAD(P)-dependent oxidoreductase [Burkholderiaceae bacterium]|nr:SDR family NAD(P)-dependent oxidoreductase [Burkholderiaceae bacterium]